MSKYKVCVWLVLFISMIGTTQLLSYSIFDRTIGTEILHHDTRATAMGSSGVAAGFSLFDSSINPANLYFLEDNNLAMSYSLIKNSENRAVPLWNFFDSYVDESTYARNENFYNELAFGVNYSLNFDDIKLSAAIMYRPIVNFGANYDEQVRNAGNQNDDNYPPILAKNFIETSGTLDSYSFLLSLGMPFLIGDVSVAMGAEVSYLIGNYDYQRRIHWTDAARNATPSVLNDVYESEENKMDGIGIKFGLASQVTERWRVGFAYSPKVSLETEIKTKDSIDGLKVKLDDPDDYIIPSRMRMGFLFMPRNNFKTNFQLDFEIINYSELKNYIDPEEPLNNIYYENGYAFYVGMEHYIGRAMPLRLGFSHRTAKQDKSISLPIISAGTSFPILSHIQLDLAAEYGKREYNALDLFPDGFYNRTGLWPNNHIPQDRDWGAPDSVTESFWKVFTTVSYKF